MTFKEFLDFISQSGSHFVGFLIVLGMVSTTVVKLAEIIFKNFIKPVAKLFEEKQTDKKD